MTFENFVQVKKFILIWILILMSGSELLFIKI